MNFIINLLNSKDYNVILIIINTLLKKRYYISYIISDEKVIIKAIVNLLIKKVFKLHELLSFIMCNRKSQFVIIV